MSTPLKPLGDRIVATKDKPAERTSSGLYLPDSSKEKPVVAVVAAVGKDVTDIKAGDKIVYREYAPTELKIDGTEYLIIKEEDVLATLA